MHGVKNEILRELFGTLFKVSNDTNLNQLPILLLGSSPNRKAISWIDKDSCDQEQFQNYTTDYLVIKKLLCVLEASC
jgi:hypothetical protein